MRIDKRVTLVVFFLNFRPEANLSRLNIFMCPVKSVSTNRCLMPCPLCLLHSPSNGGRGMKGRGAVEAPHTELPEVRFRTFILINLEYAVHIQKFWLNFDLIYTFFLYMFYYYTNLTPILRDAGSLTFNRKDSN